MKKLLLLLSISFIGLAAFAQEIFDMPHALGTFVTGINDSGEICGYYNTSTATIAFEINKYGDTIILNPGSYMFCNATGISNSGMVVGNYGTSSATAQGYVFLPNPGRNASGHYNTTITSSWGGTNMSASGINMDTCVAGSYQVGGNDDGALQCISASQVVDLRCSNNGTVYPTYLFDIDKNGDVCGFIIQGAEEQAAIYRGVGVGWDTFQVGGFLKSRILGMNDNGWICGNFNSETEGFYAKKPQAQALSNLTRIKINGAVTIFPSHINNNNEIVGSYTDATGTYHGFIIANYNIGFVPTVNGYTFRNVRDGAFPSLYRDSIKYNYDPYLQNDSLFPRKPNHTIWPTGLFPDWPDFVKSMVESGFYTMSHGGKLIDQTAYGIWAASARLTFSGNCFGMSNTSLQIYDSIRWYQTLFPAAARYSGQIVNSYPLVDTVLSPICQTQFKQWSLTYGRQQQAHQPDPLNVTMQGLKQSMRNSRGRPHQTLIINISTSGNSHAVVPYLLKPGYQGNGIDTIFIYDSNFPNQNGLAILVDQNARGTGLGEFYYDAAGQLPMDWGTDLFGNGLWLRGLDTNDLAPQRIQLRPLEGGPIWARSASMMYAYFNDSSTVTLADDNDSIAYISVDSSTSTSLIMPINNISGTTGLEPLGVFSTSGVATVSKANSSANTGDYLRITDYSYLIRCDRTSGVDTGDNYAFSNGSLTYINNGTGTHGIAYTINDEDSGSEYNYYITGLNVTTGNKIAVATSGANGMVIQNFGPATTYTITTDFVTPDSIITFTGVIPIQANTQHTILPHDTTYSGIYILVDTGMTGRIEDSIFITPVATGISNVNSAGIKAWPVPSGNDLFMSGPQGPVSYTIVDITGRTVATGELNFGNGTTQKFNVGSFAPGVYTITGKGTQGNWTYMFVKQ